MMETWPLSEMLQEPASGQEQGVKLGGGGSGGTFSSSIEDVLTIAARPHLLMHSSAVPEHETRGKRRRARLRTFGTGAAMLNEPTHLVSMFGCVRRRFVGRNCHSISAFGSDDEKSGEMRKWMRL
jgi:hypothetical protein